MNIAIIGTGNVGSTLALGFKKAGHKVVFGVRNALIDFKGKELAVEHSIDWFEIPVAVEKSEVLVICTPAIVAKDIANQLGDVANKVIIDTMNMVFTKIVGYTNTADIILHNCNCADVVKCFNTTGFENMADPNYGNEAIDMFVAGNSEKGKSTAIQLAKDIGFAEVYDFGGNDKFTLLEQLALCWINLAIIRKQGRNIGFKVLRK